MSLPFSILSLLSKTPPQTSFLGDAYATEEIKKHNLLIQGNMPPRLDWFSYQLTKLGEKCIGKDHGKSFAEFLDIMAQIRICFSDPHSDSIKNYFTHNGVDTRHNDTFEMYIMDPQLRSDYVIQCYMDDPEKVASVLAYTKGLCCVK